MIQQVCSLTSGIRAIIAIATCMCIAGCGQTKNGHDGNRSSTQSVHLKITPQQNLALREAPMLHELVQAGELPALDQRLPDNPMVVPIVNAPGLYGGTWRKFDIKIDLLAMRMITNYYGLTRWKPDASDVIPGLAESWEHSSDGCTTTFHLRRGLRWSDGAPFTSADILYWWKLCLDDRVILTPSEWAYADGQRMEVRAPDDYTVEFTYAVPYYFVPLVMASGFWVPETMLTPRHYLELFDPDVNEQYADFNELIRRNNAAINPERPTLGPWQLVYYSQTGDRAVYERNPYYYAVDPNGRQLPYIDRIESIRVQNSEAGVLYAISGAVDAQFRWIDFRDYALLKQFQDRGNYRIETWEEGTAAWHAVFVNYSPADPQRRALFRQQKFRAALAIAIDRERINQIVWNGLSRPQAAAITDESWHFKSPRGQTVLKEWITRWSEHDPMRANTYLDSVGLAERDREGFRLYQGRPFGITLDHFDVPYAAEEAELIKSDWEAVGIRTTVKRATSTDLWARISQGKFDMYMEHNSELDLFTFPGYVFPVDAKTWHPRVGRWYATNGRDGEAPTGFMAELLDLFQRCQREPDLAARHELVLDAIEIQLREGPLMIGTTGRQKSLVLVSNDLCNVPPTGILGPWAVCQPASSYPEQMYFSAERLYGEQADRSAALAQSETAP